MPETVVLLLVDEPEAQSSVDTAGGNEHVIRPQRDLPVAGQSGEANAFFHQPAADAKPAGLRLDEEKTQLGDLLRLPDEKHTADDLAIPLGDPAPLQLRVGLLDELRNDLRHERLEPLIPAVLSGVEDPMTVNDPPHVAGPMGPQNVRHLWLGPSTEEPLDGSHRPDQALLTRFGKATKHCSDVTSRTRVERGEGLQTSLC